MTRRAATAVATLLAPLTLLFVSACSGGGRAAPDAGGDGDEGGGGDGAEPGATAAFAGFDFDLFVGDFWRFAWATESVSTVQGNGTTTEVATGQFSVELVASQAFGDASTAFEVEVTGDTVDPDGHSYAPIWKFLALERGQLLGSTNGTAFTPLFDATGASWTGGGFFSDFSGVEREAAASTLRNEFVDTPAVSAGILIDEGGCQFFASIGELLCPDEEKIDISEREFFKGGIGPLGYSFERTVTDDGGGFFTSFTTRRDVGLIDSNLRGDDGFEPQLPPWRVVAPMPEARSDLGAAGHDGKLYVFGGNGTNGADLSSADVYDPTADSWSALPDMETLSGACSAAVVGERIFVFPQELTGLDDTLDIYDPELDSWTTRSIPSAVADFFGDISLAEVTPVSDPDLPGVDGIALTGLEGAFDPVRIFYYDPAGNEWFVIIPPANERVFRHGLASDGRFLFLVGGIRQGTGFGAELEPSSRVVRVDAVTDVQSSRPSLARPAADLATVVVDGLLLALGGLRDFEAQRTVEGLDLSGGNWSSRSGMPGPRMEHAAAVVDGLVYVVGGFEATNARTTEVFVYDPSAE